MSQGLVRAVIAAPQLPATIAARLRPNARELALAHLDN